MIKDFHLPPGKKLFFASDVHLGEPDAQTTRRREKKLISWLDQHQSEAAAFFLLGDIFDFWFEYRDVVPKGFTRLFGKLATITDSGTPVFFFTGNHDMWLFDYLPQELNIPVYRHPQSFHVNGISFQIGHGDGLGPGQRSYKILKAFFTNPLCQWLFKWLHPNLGFSLARFWSSSSRKHHGMKRPFTSEQQEWIFQYCKRMEHQKPHNYYIFGHRHLPLELPVNETSIYFNLGEWIEKCTYGVYDGDSFEIKSFH